MTTTTPPTRHRDVDRRNTLILGAFVLALGLASVVGVFVVGPNDDPTAGRDTPGATRATSTTAVVGGVPPTTAAAAATTTPTTASTPTTPTTPDPSGAAGRPAPPAPTTGPSAGGATEVPPGASQEPMTEHPYTGGEAPLFLATAAVAAAVLCRTATRRSAATG